MSQSLLYAFLVFVAVMFFTPGPNNVMLLSSGLTYGFRRTLPHIAGVTIGGCFMIAAVGIGLGSVFVAYPALKMILKYAGAAYLIYLAIGIAMVLGHNVWSGGALPVAVTLTGWLILAKGVLILLVPTDTMSQLIAQLHYAEHAYLYLAPALFLGVYLAWAGFTAAKR